MDSRKNGDLVWGKEVSQTGSGIVWPMGSVSRKLSIGIVHRVVDP